MAALRSKNDGYTMLMNVISSGTLNPPSRANCLQMGRATFIARTNISRSYRVRADSSWKNLKELMEAVKKDPTQFKYGTSASEGLPPFPSPSSWRPPASIRIRSPGWSCRRSPDRDRGCRRACDFAAQNLVEVISLIQAKRVRGLAVTTRQRVRQLPDIRPAAEAGFEAFKPGRLEWISGPAKLPDSVIKKWDDAVRDALQDPAFIAEMETSAPLPPIWAPKISRPRWRPNTMPPEIAKSWGSGNDQT